MHRDVNATIPSSSLAAGRMVRAAAPGEAREGGMNYEHHHTQGGVSWVSQVLAYIRSTPNSVIPVTSTWLEFGHKIEVTGITESTIQQHNESKMNIPTQEITWKANRVNMISSCCLSNVDGGRRLVPAPTSSRAVPYCRDRNQSRYCPTTLPMLCL